MDAAGEPVIAAVSTLGDFAQTAGVVVAALLGATALLARSDRARSVAMLCALVLTPVLLVASIWSTPQIEPLRDRPLLALGAACAGLVLLALGAVAIHRKPELVALAAAAALPFRVPIESGGDTANLLVPLYLVIAAGVLAYAVPRLRATPGLDDDDVALQAGIARMAAGRRRRAVRRAGRVLVGLRPRAVAGHLLLRPVRAALRAARADRLVAAPRRPLPRRAARARGGVRGDRLRRVRAARAAAQSEGHQLQPVRVLFPRELAVLRSEHLRALPRHGHARAHRGAAVGAPHGARRGLRVRARAVVGRARADAVAVVVHGAARGARRARRPALGGAPRRARRHGVRRRRRGRGARGAGSRGGRPVDRRRDERALDARLRGARPGSRTAGRGLGRGVLPARVPPPREDVERAGVGGVAHDPDHRGGRAGAWRPRAVPGAARRRDRRVAARRAGVDRPRGDRSGVRRTRRAHAALRGVPRGPAGVGLAGGRRSTRPRRGGDRGRASAPPRRSAGRG